MLQEQQKKMPTVSILLPIISLVVLLSLPDSAFLQGGMTDEQGVFKIVTDVNEGPLEVSWKRCW